MPVWYARLKPWIDRGELTMLGVIQEQHADRCRLFQQWKELKFPVVQDALNTVAIDVVPVYIAIDEHGVVRGRPRRPDKFISEFLEQSFPAPAAVAPVANPKTATVEHWTTQHQQQSTIASQLGLADSLLLWQTDAAAAQRAIKLYTNLAGKLPTRADVAFRLGVARRLLYELNGRRDVSDFSAAVAHWESALQLNPNQYIYRRRIEQYGPRLKKPYSFYDWIHAARAEVAERGDTPLPLQVEPNGAEFAERARMMNVDTSSQHPDPQNRITRDHNLVTTHVNFVPSQPQPGDVVAVHVGLSVRDQAKWNHEAAPLVMWIDSGDDAKLSSKRIEDRSPHLTAESQQPLSLSFEVQVPDSQADDIQLKAFALFNICENSGGQCLFRRRDFTIRIPVAVE